MLPTIYPDQLTITPLAAEPNASVSVPGSKSITNRAIILAALHSRMATCELTNFLDSEDTDVMRQSLMQLGYLVEHDPQRQIVRIGRSNDLNRLEMIPARKADLFLANSGTSMRFLTAMVALGHGRFRLDGVPRMRERPIQDLLDALGHLGVRASSEHETGCPPAIVEANGVRGGTTRVRGDISSQFLSALLMVAPFAHGPVEIIVEGTRVSEPYIEMTLRMLRDWGHEVETERNTFRIRPSAGTPQLRYAIEPDASAASYFFGLAAITGGRVTVLGLNRTSMQGDVAFVDALEKMGCRVESCSEGITVHGRDLKGIEIDMNAISDTVMTLAAVACFAEGPTRIRNVAHIRHKETDRISALATELRRAGVGIEEFQDGLTVTPGPLRPATFATYNDHRMAMSLALLGLKVPGMIIENPGCVAKTYPGFWHDLEAIRRGN